MLIHPLIPADMAAYRSLRLESLRDSPLAYVTDLCEEERLSDDEFRQRLSPDQPSVTFGAFQDEQLVGIASLVRMTRIRQQFRAMIAAMYVTPAFRSRGIARKLIEAAIERARSWPEVEEVCLCVTVGNEGARRLYVNCGFTPDFIDPRYFKYEGRYYDLEWLRLEIR